MTVSNTEKFRLPYPEDNEPIRNLPDILKSQAEGIDDALARFDYQGGDQTGLTARVASLETRINAIRDNYVTLYDNDKNTISGAISLSETAANFEKLTICFKNNDEIYGSMDVANPNGKIISLATQSMVTSGFYYLKSRVYLIDGKTINTYRKTADTPYWVGWVSVNDGKSPQRQDLLCITQVYGTRKMSLV